MADLTYLPATPSEVDGILFTVTGEVAPTDAVAAIQVKDSNDKVRIKSPVFTQENRPAGTGPATFTLEVDATSGTFEIYLYTDDENWTTDPIYYFNDGPPDYLYPDGDEVASAIEEAMGNGTSVSVTKSGDVLTVMVGGKWSGREVTAAAGADTLTGGAGTVDIDMIAAPGGPFIFGPIYLAEDVYEADLVIVGGVNDGDSLLTGAVAVTVTAAP